ncbi:unnamed protein product [Chrysodeixis includens]|uniref:Uncharacterized protein n=1 Tax=Chrysodeixis includens TaxID=689277 RepID=A0A9N8Q008_CHRIL|nr:unnamed protein product [Chrysodeixis includens]
MEPAALRHETSCRCNTEYRTEVHGPSRAAGTSRDEGRSFRAIAAARAAARIGALRTPVSEVIAAPTSDQSQARADVRGERLEGWRLRAPRPRCRALQREFEDPNLAAHGGQGRARAAPTERLAERSSGT